MLDFTLDSGTFADTDVVFRPHTLRARIFLAERTGGVAPDSVQVRKSQLDRWLADMASRRLTVG